MLEADWAMPHRAVRLLLSKDKPSTMTIWLSSPCRWRGHQSLFARDILSRWMTLL